MRKDLLKKAIRFLDLPEDVDSNVPRITVVGRELMLVENVAGIRRCTPDEVVLLPGAGTPRKKFFQYGMVGCSSIVLKRARRKASQSA